MRWFRTLIDRLRPEPLRFPFPIAVPVQKGQPTEICETEWRMAIEATRAQSYAQGLALGELLGRRALAAEIAAEFPSGVNEDEAQRIIQRQLH